MRRGDATPPLRLYALVTVASCALSFVSAVLQPVTNPDGVLYMEAAEYFAVSNWSAGRSVYPWPLYSLLISVGVRLGVDAYTAAQIVNAVFDAAIVILVLDIVRRFSRGDRILMALAALLVLLSPRLIEIRSAVIRDHGFLAFYLLALDVLVWDFAAPSLRKKIGVAAAVVGAALFRMEAFFLFVLIPGFYLYSRSSTHWRRLAVVAGCLSTCVVLPFVYSFKHELMLLLVDLWGHGRMPPVFYAFDSVAMRVQVLREWAPGSEWQAFIGLVLGILLFRGIRGIGTLVFSVSLLAFAKTVRARYAFALRLMVWFATGQLLLVLAYLPILLAMDLRYVLNITLFSTIGVAFVLRELIRVWPRLFEGGPRTRWVLPAIAVALLASFLNAVPRNAPLYLKEAGEWLRAGLSPHHTVLTNDIRILYYARRLVVDTPSRVNVKAGDAGALAEWGKYDYLALDVPRNSALDQRLQQHFARRPDGIIGDGASRVLIFKTAGTAK